MFYVEAQTDRCGFKWSTCIITVNTFFPETVPSTKYKFYKTFKMENSEVCLLNVFYCIHVLLLLLLLLWNCVVMQGKILEMSQLWLADYWSRLISARWLFKIYVISWLIGILLVTNSTQFGNCFNELNRPC